MIAFDTNLVLRLIVRDDEPQRRLAEEALLAAREAGESVYLADVTLCEIEWVLASQFDAAREQIATTLGQLAEDPGLAFADRPGLLAALDQYRTSRADFSDCLFGARAQAAGARTIYTFDRALRKLPGFSWLKG